MHVSCEHTHPLTYNLVLLFLGVSGHANIINRVILHAVGAVLARQVGMIDSERVSVAV